MSVPRSPLTPSIPETVNPVSDACEAAGVPCISTVVPWEAWYFGCGAKPEEKNAYRYTFHFCFGVEQFHNAYTHQWPQVETSLHFVKRARLTTWVPRSRCHIFLVAQWWCRSWI